MELWQQTGCYDVTVDFKNVYCKKKKITLQAFLDPLKGNIRIADTNKLSVNKMHLGKINYDIFGKMHTIQ